MTIFYDRLLPEVRSIFGSVQLSYAYVTQPGRTTRTGSAALGGGSRRWRVEQHFAHLHQPAHDAEALQEGAQVAWSASPKREEKQACISQR